MNVYETTFSAKCPNNNMMIEYRLVVYSPRVVMVESITDKCAEFDTGYHEDFADVLYAEIGGSQVLRAFHHGVWITTFRGVA